MPPHMRWVSYFIRLKNICVLNVHLWYYVLLENECMGDILCTNIKIRKYLVYKPMHLWNKKLINIPSGKTCKTKGQFIDAPPILSNIELIRLCIGHHIAPHVSKFREYYEHANIVVQEKMSKLKISSIYSELWVFHGGIIVKGHDILGTCNPSGKSTIMKSNLDR